MSKYLYIFKYRPSFNENVKKKNMDSTKNWIQRRVKRYSNYNNRYNIFFFKQFQTRDSNY